MTEVAPSAWASLWERAPELPMTERIVVPFAFVSSAAAAGVHAAVGPQHFHDSLLIGTLFAVSALLQLAWAGLLTVHRSRTLLLLGAAGNLAVLALWVLAPVPAGPWDAAGAVWQLAVVASCVVLLRASRTGGPVVTWREWHRGVHVYVAGSVLLLGALTFTAAAA